MTAARMTQWTPQQRETVLVTEHQSHAASSWKRPWNASCCACTMQTPRPIPPGPKMRTEVTPKKLKYPLRTCRCRKAAERACACRATADAGRSGSLARSMGLLCIQKQRMGTALRERARCYCSGDCVRRTLSSWRVRCGCCRTHRLQSLGAVLEKAGPLRCGGGGGRGHDNALKLQVNNTTVKLTRHDHVV